MTKFIVFNRVTLDGVTQAPGRPDEDRRAGSPTAAGALHICRRGVRPRRRRHLTSTAIAVKSAPPVFSML